ncbi:hypothetical protein EOPP23_06780 [Endozoicomonas sp. OPT23]|uniref:hypothetical protein n=1 Tax=Endozoicomonas sp. OPT23 TaxID=2072845 RepID=UPI00129A4CA8|nr:hypothetical protein [Endozoicomonas sp. OPT23]MRI32690.1 hypothetical protein [Endozoicomonas sp. OPT23]
MQVLLCDEFELKKKGEVLCSGEASFITLEELQASPVADGVTMEQANELLTAALLVLSIAFVFSLILRQLR